MKELFEKLQTPVGKKNKPVLLSHEKLRGKSLSITIGVISLYSRKLYEFSWCR